MLGYETYPPFMPFFLVVYSPLAHHLLCFKLKSLSLQYLLSIFPLLLLQVRFNIYYLSLPVYTQNLVFHSPFMQKQSPFTEPRQTSVVALRHFFPRHVADRTSSHTGFKVPVSGVNPPDSNPCGTPFLSSCLIPEHSPMAIHYTWPGPGHPIPPTPRESPVLFTFTIRCLISNKKKRRFSHELNHFFSIPLGLSDSLGVSNGLSVSFIPEGGGWYLLEGLLLRPKCAHEDLGGWV